MQRLAEGKNQIEGNKHNNMGTDGNSKDVFLHSSDDPSLFQQDSYACCGLSTKPTDNSCPGTVIAGVCTNADNDSNRGAGVLASQPENPNPNADLFGYACCY